MTTKKIEIGSRVAYFGSHGTVTDQYSRPFRYARVKFDDGRSFSVLERQLDWIAAPTTDPCSVCRSRIFVGPLNGVGPTLCISCRMNTRKGA